MAAKRENEWMRTAAEQKRLIGLPQGNHQRVYKRIYDEWKGLGRFVGQPMEGGIEALEQSTKKRWRKRYKGADQKHFSRVVQLMSAIEGGTTNGRSLQEVIDELEGLFVWKKKSLSALVVELQHRGLIGKRVRNSQQSP